MAIKILLALLPIFTLASGAGWSYTGEYSAEKWGELEPNCLGSNQSPINIIPGEAEYDDDLKPFEFTNYEQANPGQYYLTNAHSTKISFNVSGVVPSVSGGGLGGTYNFLQLHIHWGRTSAEGSEHLINNMAYPAELHMVHLHSDYPTFADAAASNNPSAATVLGVMIDVGEKDNEVFEDVLDKIEDIVYSNDITPIEGIPLKSFLPEDDLDVFHRYQGSLTTPTCNELVKWTVFKEPIYLSEAQLEKMRSTLMFNENGETADPLTYNFRPVQPLNSRKVTTSMKPMDGGSSSVMASFFALLTSVLSALYLS